MTRGWCLAGGGLEAVRACGLAVCGCGGSGSEGDVPRALRAWFSDSACGGSGGGLLGDRVRLGLWLDGRRSQGHQGLVERLGRRRRQ